MPNNQVKHTSSSCYRKCHIFVVRCLCSSSLRTRFFRYAFSKNDSSPHHQHKNVMKCRWIWQPDRRCSQRCSSRTRRRHRRAEWRFPTWTATWWTRCCGSSIRAAVRDSPSSDSSCSLLPTDSICLGSRLWLTRYRIVSHKAYSNRIRKNVFTVGF